MKFLSLCLWATLAMGMIGCTQLDSASKKAEVGQHGGQLKRGKNFSVEMVQSPRGMKFYTYDKNNRLLSVKEDLEIDAKYSAIRSKEEYTLDMDPKKDHILGTMDKDHVEKEIRVKADVSANGKEEEFGFLIQ